MKKGLLLLGFLFFIKCSYGQMPHDAIYMPKKTSCIALTYSNSSWNEYWENTLKRDNKNIGTLTTQNVMPMIAYGITNKVNLIFGLPYVWTSASKGNLMGQRGFQDISFWAKYKLFEKKGLSIHTAIGASAPVSNYVPDFLPMSIGLRSRTLSGRLIFNYLHTSGLYLSGHATYTLRGNIKIDKDSYQAYEKIYNSNTVALPDANDQGLRIGYIKDGSRFQAEMFAERFACIGGDAIRRNDMPFPTNNMRMTNIGFYGKYQPKNLGVNLRIARVIDGLNVGQSTAYTLGLLFQINPKVNNSLIEF